MARITVVINSILPRQEAFLVDAPTPALTAPVDSGLEPYVTVSRHTAPTVRRSSASVDLSAPPPKG